MEGERQRELGERMQRALQSLVYLPHLQAQTDAEAALPAAGAAAAASPPGAAAAAGGRGRPWDRGDLFRRLATFRSSTWFCKPEAVGPVECARRGWTNTGPDLLACEFCKAKLSCPIPPDMLPDEAAGVAARYAARLGEAHDAACPWRTSASSPSLLQFPPLAQEAVRRDFEARCAALQRLACLPPLAGEPYAALAAAAGKQRLDSLLLQGPAAAASVAAEPAAAADGPKGPEAAAAGPGAAAEAADAQPALAEGLAVLGSQAFEARARALALCGWDLKLLTAAPPSPPPAAAGDARQQQEEQRRQREAEAAALPPAVGPESAALQCSLCAARAGLWTCFPQCRPVVLQLPAVRRGAAAGGGAAASPSAAVAKAVNRNVAADMGTTIAGGAMGAPAAGAAAAPFGAQPVAAFGSLVAAQNGAAAAPAAEQPGEQQQAPAAAPAAAPFGGGGGGMPVFGFAALHAPPPAAAPAAAAGTSHAELAGSKRKAPDFSWAAVMADIDAKAAAEKRSKAAGAAGSSSAPAAPGAAAASASGKAPSRQQQLAAAAAAAGKFKGAAAAALDPLALHRPFCPWVNAGPGGDKEGRCGWRWCLQQLAAPAGPAGAAAAGLSARSPADDGEGDEDEQSGGGKRWDPKQLLRSVLQQVDVHK